MNKEPNTKQALGGWQSIESCPYLTSVLVFIPNWDHYGPGIYRALRIKNEWDSSERWHSTAWCSGRDIVASAQPTHWMQLPEPPTEA